MASHWDYLAVPIAADTLIEGIRQVIDRDDAEWELVIMSPLDYTTKDTLDIGGTAPFYTVMSYMVVFRCRR
jgi:hypothetical protein